MPHLKVCYIDEASVAAVAFSYQTQQLLLCDLTKRLNTRMHTHAARHMLHITSMPKCAKAMPNSSALISPLPSTSMKRKMRSAIDLIERNQRRRVGVGAEGGGGGGGAGGGGEEAAAEQEANLCV